MPELLRAYIPLHVGQVRELADTGRLLGPLEGWCAPSGSVAEDEEREYAALQRAARVAVEAGRAVLVAAADVDPAGVDAAGMVQVAGEILSSSVAAVLVGDDVLGAEPVLGDREQIELSWYDTTELAYLASLL